MGRNMQSPRTMVYLPFGPAPGKSFSISERSRVEFIHRNCTGRHRFWCHRSATESLVFHGWIDPQDKDNLLDKNALRNLQGYLADCDRANLKPSVFQLILWAYNTSTVMTPPFWVPLWLLTWTHYLLACWVAQGFLGYVLGYCFTL